MKQVNVITPLHNEEANLTELASRLDKVFAAEGKYRWQWTAVDDGSSDNTRKYLKSLRLHGDIQLIGFSRNFGQQAALKAGLDHSESDAVIFLDGDLQDPPESIPLLLRKWEEGASVVLACRKSRAEPFMRRMLIEAFHRIFGALTRDIMPRESGNFGLVDKTVANVLKGMSEHSLYLPGLRAWAGFSRATVEYDRAAREHGDGLSLPKLFASAWDAITGFTETPLRLIAVLGVVFSAAGFFYGSVLLVERILQLFGFFKDLEVLGFTTVAVSVFFMGGVQLICLGVIGEYLARIYREVKGRPLYLVEEVSRQGVEEKPPTPSSLD